MKSKLLNSRLRKYVWIITIVCSTYTNGQMINENFPTVNGPVDAIIQDGNTIYIGGEFTYLGKHSGLTGAFDAATAENDEAMPKVLADDSLHDPGIIGVVPDGSGGWFIGGLFSSVGGYERSNVAHINGDKTVDEMWNPGTNGQIFRMLLHGNTLYAFGLFTVVGGKTRNSIVAINAQTGVVTNWNPNALGGVFAGTVSGNTLYIVGGFTSVGGVPRAGAAAIDLTTAHVTQWNPNLSGIGYSITLADSLAYVGGPITGVGDSIRQGIAAISLQTGQATAWNPEIDSGSFRIIVIDSIVYAGGLFKTVGGQPKSALAAINRFTGALTSWNPVITVELNQPNIHDPDPSVIDMLIDGSTMYIAGGFTGVNGNERYCVAAIDVETGGTLPWHPTVNEPAFSIAKYQNIVYIGGEFTSIGGQLRQHLAAINATTYDILPWNPGTDSVVTSLAVSGSTVYVGGNFELINGETRKKIAAVDAVSGVPTLWNPGADRVVHSIALDGNTLYAGGSFSTMGDSIRHNLASLDAVTGEVLPWNPSPNYDVFSVLKNDTTLYICGNFHHLDTWDITRPHIAAFSTLTGEVTNWIVTTHGTIMKMAISDNIMYVVGYIDDINETPRHHIAAIDVTTAELLPFSPNFNGSTNSVNVSGNVVYVGGDFTSVEGQSRNYFAGIDAVTGIPTSVDYNTNGRVTTSFTVGSNLYVSGWFNSFGGYSTGNLAAVDNTPAAFNVAPNFLSFGDVHFGSQITDSVVVENTAVATLNVSYTYGDNKQFTVTPHFAHIPPSGSKKFYVTYTPSEVGEVNASVVFNHNILGTPDSITLNATGLAALFAVASPSISFGNVRCGQSKYDTLMIYNPGNLPLSFTAASNDGEQFTLNPVSGVIAGGDSGQFVLSFTPGSTGEKNGIIVFSDNTLAGLDTLQLSGTGVISVYSVSTNELSYGGVFVDSVRKDSVTVKNSGTALLFLNAIETNNEMFSNNIFSGGIELGDSLTIVVTFHPTAKGMYHAALLLTHNAPGSPDTIPLTGYGVGSTYFRTIIADTMLSKKSVKMKYKNKKLIAQPNIVTVVENVFKKLPKKGALVLGVAQTNADSAKKYAWLANTSAMDFGKLYLKKHTSLTVYPIDSARSKPKHTKLSKVVKPTAKIFNNRAFEQGMIFKFNLLASQDTIFPFGFGGLTLDTSFTLFGRPLRGLTLSQIGKYLDSLMTYWKRFHITNDTAYAQLDAFITHIIKPVNEYFYAPMLPANTYIDSVGITKRKNPFAVNLLGVKLGSTTGGIVVDAGKTSEPENTVSGFGGELPETFALLQNFPNPFNPITEIQVAIPEELDGALGTLTIYNILGQKVATLIENSEVSMGVNSFTFDASHFASGVYFYRISVNNGAYGAMKKMILLK